MKKWKTEREMQKDALLKDGDYTSIRDLLNRLDNMYPDKPILAELDRDKKIVYKTCKELREEVMNLGQGLISSGLKDCHIAIIAENSVRYLISDMTISSGVGVVTPIDKDAPIELTTLLLDKCDANAVICGAAFVKKVRQVMDSLPKVRTIITIDKKMDGCLFYDDLVEIGKNSGPESEYRTMELDVNKTAKILFTSGTTGPNKGVKLTNANLTANLVNCMDVIIAQPGNTSMSILPMHHAIEINTHVMARLGCGKLTYINDNMRNMMTNIKIFKPNIVTIVPMIANAMYKAIWANAAKQGKTEKLKKGIKISNLLRKAGIDKTHSMFKDLYEPFGGNLNMMVCGGSMLNPNVVKGFNDLGVRIENGYGITECGPLISMNGDTLSEHLSVGKPCPQLEAKILNPDENGVGELCIRGKSVSKGYYKDPEATAEVFYHDGFFNTGDSAYIGKNGKIFLVGRKKNTIVLSNGKNICPEEIENNIESNLDYVNEAVVYQASYKSNDVSIKVLCAGLYIEDEEIRRNHDMIVSDIRKINSIMPKYKNIDYVELQEKECEKTSSKKIIRTLLPTTCSMQGLKIDNIE